VLKNETGGLIEKQRQKRVFELRSIAIDAHATAIRLDDPVYGFGGGCVVGDRGDVSKIVLGSAGAEN